MILDINKVRKDFGYGAIFEELSFSLKEGEKICIIGPNGGGKSTLLKMIAGIERWDSGTISIRKGARVAYLDQTSPDQKDDRIVEDILRDGFAELLQIENDLNKAYEEMAAIASPEEYDRMAGRVSRLQQRFQDGGGYNIDTEINMVCSGLGIQNKMRHQNYDSLSGGEKTLVHLAKGLLRKPDLFLLDEPTNHLDIKRIEWLEQYIKAFPGAVVMVSHDRRLLDHVSSRLLEIDNGEGTVYDTNYSGYLMEKERRYNQLMEKWEDQQAYFRRLEERATRMAQAGMAVNSKVMTRKAGVMFARIEREKERMALKKPYRVRRLDLDFEKQDKGGKRAIEVRKLRISTGNGRTIVDDASFFVGVGERVFMVGNNGSGKTSVLKSILGEQDLPYHGEIVVSPGIWTGYLPQIIRFKDDTQKVLDYFRYEVGTSEEKARSILFHFHFDKENVAKSVGSLSGGERIRLRLAVLLQQSINTLIFDEPTNHIDIPTREALEEAIENFNGTLLIVSHDRFFIDKFAGKMIEMEDGKAITYIGNYEDYQAKKMQQGNEQICEKALRPEWK